MAEASKQNDKAPQKQALPIGVLLRVFWLEIDGTGLDWFHSFCQGHLFSQKNTYDTAQMLHSQLFGGILQLGPFGLATRRRGQPQKGSLFPSGSLSKWAVGVWPKVPTFIDS